MTRFILAFSTLETGQPFSALRAASSKASALEMCIRDRRRAVEAADADIQALADDHRALQVSLVAELVSHYAGLRATQMRLAIAHDNLRTLREAERLAEQARRRGLGSQAEVMQARAERETAEAQPPLLEADIARFSHAIGVLVGGFPGDWRAALAEPAAVLPRCV